MPIPNVGGATDSLKVVPDKAPQRTISIVNEDMQLSKIVQHISGQRWTVDYYLQVNGEDDEITRFDPLSPPTIQQYIKVKGMVISIDSYLEANEAMETVGSGYLMAPTIPNQGDAFIAMVNSNRKALFTITNITKQNYELSDVYLIEYQLDLFLDASPDAESVLDDKTVRTYIYDRNHILTNSSPLILESRWYDISRIKVDKRRIINLFFNIAVNTDTNLLMVPNQPGNAADPMLDKFIHTIFDINDHPLMMKLNRFTVEHDWYDQPNIWSALLRQDKTLLATGIQKYTALYTSSIEGSEYLQHMSFLPINNIVFPVDLDSNILESLPPPGGIALTYVENPFRSNVVPPDNLIPVYNVDEPYYVLSQKFYDNDTANLTKLEGLVDDYFENREIDPIDIKELLDDCQYWHRLEQFYYLPILVHLMNYMEQYKYTT